MKNLRNVISEPTRVTNTTSTLLDTVIVNEDVDVVDSGVVEFDSKINDHRGTYVNINTQLCNNISYKWEIWCYNKGDYEMLNYVIENTDWKNLYNGCSNVNDACLLFYDKLT